jgi:DNA modification methylase
VSAWRVLEGDCREVLRSLPAGSVHVVVTSPPYFGLRDYGTGAWEGGDAACDHIKVTQHREQADRPKGWDGAFRHTSQPLPVAYGDECGRCGAARVDRQIGLEETPDEYVASLVAVFREVRRALRDDGTVWLNLGDSYAGSWGNQGRKAERGTQRPINGDMLTSVLDGRYPSAESRTGAIPPGADYKAKDLLGVPWMVAFALRADGWYLRSEVIWSKPNPMPESVTDRPTKAHEQVFVLSKSARYYYDADAIRESAQDWGSRDRQGSLYDGTMCPQNGHAGLRDLNHAESGRNKRSVWTVATQPYAGAHFATFPPKLIEPCVLAGCPERACGKCGAPWMRVVERTPMVVRPTAKREAWQAKDDYARTQVGGTMLEAPASRTVGWEPSCAHSDGGARGVVLDPFAGAGTTGMVAVQHGREFVGVELSAEYAQMARERLEAFMRLGYRSPREVKAVEGQPSLFGGASS